MRFVLPIIIMSLLPLPAMAVEDGRWRCEYSRPDYSTTATVQVVGGKVIFDNGSGSRVVVPDPAMSDDYMFWTYAGEWEFYPKEPRLTQKDGKTVDTYTCTRQP